MRLLVSTPLQPLASRMRELSESCVALDVMTAFVTTDAVSHVIEPAIGNGASVRFLTGTFGNVTRKSTFAHVRKLVAASDGKSEARIWHCGSHGNLHAKLFVWRKSNGEAVVWIGSANLTDAGLQNVGELVAEIDIAAGADGHAAARDAFEREWARSSALDDAFLKSYRESPRTTFPLQPFRRERRAVQTGARSATRMFVATAAREFGEESAVFERVTELLTGAAEYWHRDGSPLLEQIRVGDLCLYFDVVDNKIGVVEVTDIVRDGKHIVFAYEPSDEYGGWRRRTTALRDSLAALGLRRTKKALAVQWVPTDRIASALALVNPKRPKNARRK